MVSGNDVETAPEDPAWLRSLVRNGISAGKVGFWEWNVATNRVRYTAAVARLYGLPPSQENGGVSCEQVLAAIHPEDRLDAERNLIQARQEGGFLAMEYRTQHAGERTYRVRVQGQFDRDMDGVFVRSCGVILDLTDDDPNPEAVSPSELLAVAIHDMTAALERCSEPVRAVLRPPLDELIARFREMVRIYLRGDDDAEERA